MGRHIRETLLNPRWKVGIYSSRAELLLYAADRAQHVEEVIRPAMGQGKVVLCDRYEDSTNVYQGIARKLGLKWTQQVNDFATGRLHPNLVVLLDIPTHIGLGRVRSRVRRNQDLTRKGRLVKKDRLERESLEFHERVRKGFLRLAKQHPRRYAIVDATRTVEEVAEQIEKAVFQRMGKRRGKRRKL